MSVADAVKFLDGVDKDERLQEEVRTNAQNFVQMGERHGYKFTDMELDRALREHWGLPSKRKTHPHPYTCSCFSEPPGV